VLEVGKGAGGGRQRKVKTRGGYTVFIKTTGDGGEYDASKKKHRLYICVGPEKQAMHVSNK